jgi:hypothetical protein
VIGDLKVTIVRPARRARQWTDPKRLRFAAASRGEPPRPLAIVTSEDLALTHPPLADCARYDQLRCLDAAA